MGLGTGLTLAFLALMIITAAKSVAIVPQSEEYVVERLGKFRVTLNAGINILVPWLDNIAHKVVVLERQLDAFKVSVITADNVEIQLETTTFFRVTDAAKSVYRIRDIPLALKTTAESTIRNEAGKLELDALQSSRDQMNERILENLQEAAALWGLEVTRSEITDVQVDQQTKDAQRQQLNAERERRATVARAEGERARVQLEADAELYAAQKQAEAVKITADADAYATVKTAEAAAQQTKVIATAIADNGKPAIDYDILKRQVEAIGVLAASDNAKTIVLPTDVTKTVGALAGLQDLLKSS
ncbi:SPFH domain-containing protein [Congregibacter variabilis]|uniref:SPFH domain-containing protein n=1 Tax=Congregibacter variabilis TaxID=3081200 RepID=A0ABZ0I6I5_9GAMM|nr:SPFH domain-containing protein [Congregibacter sp. IMCC43200]